MIKNEIRKFYMRCPVVITGTEPKKNHHFTDISYILRNKPHTTGTGQVSGFQRVITGIHSRGYNTPYG